MEKEVVGLDVAAVRKAGKMFRGLQDLDKAVGNALAILNHLGELEKQKEAKLQELAGLDREQEARRAAHAQEETAREKEADGLKAEIARLQEERKTLAETIGTLKKQGDVEEARLEKARQALERLKASF